MIADLTGRNTTTIAMSAYCTDYTNAPLAME